MFLALMTCSTVMLIEESVQPSRVMARAWVVSTAQVFSMTLGSVPGVSPEDLYEGFVKPYSGHRDRGACQSRRRPTAVADQKLPGHHRSSDRTLMLGKANQILDVCCPRPRRWEVVDGRSVT